MRGCKAGTAMALLASLGVGWAATQAAAQQSCDVDGNGYVSADEAAACAERDYSTLVGNDESVSRERFERAFPETENVDDMWAEADADQDGELSPEEWSDWSARRFRLAGPRLEGLAVDDYEALEAQYHMGDDQEGRDESGGGAASTGDAGNVAQDSDGSGDNDDSDDGGSDSQAGDNGDSGDDGSSGEGGGDDASGDGSEGEAGGSSEASGDDASSDGAGGGDSSGDSGSNGGSSSAGESGGG
jgi:hypothetical protein